MSQEQTPKRAEPEVDLSKMKRNAPAIIVDIALGILFFIVAKLTDLQTAAFFGVGAALLLIVIQQFVKSVDLLGGLALFGVVMLGISAAFAWYFQDDLMIKLRTSIVGGFSSSLFLTDAAFGGRYLGERLSRYMPFKVIPRRLAFVVGGLSLIMAAVNGVLALYAPEDIWLFYTTFGDIVLFAGLFALAGPYVRGDNLPA
ncbi:MAG: septation protein IspZ [Pseudomonadota bacterium]